MFKEGSVGHFDVIDGQQRLTTIVIFLSALFTRLKSLRELTKVEEVFYKNLIEGTPSYIFSTVDYDKQLFIDCVLDQNITGEKVLETESAKRIVDAFEFFKGILGNKDEPYLTRMLKSVSEASCSTYPVKNESEAIQMFVFQNNRGKKPTNLEIIKAEFMFNIHLYGGEKKEVLIDEIKNRFEGIYKSISSIEHNINEDDILIYTLRVHFDSLKESKAIDTINRKLLEMSKEEKVCFIKRVYKVT